MPDPDGPSSRLLEHLSTAVLGLDVGLHVLSMNPAAEMLFAISAKQVLGQALNRIVPENAGLLAVLDQALHERHPVTARGQVLELPGERRITVDYSITPVDDPRQPTVVLMELTPVDRLLRLAREEKMQRDHASNRALIRGMAHEIKNPLGGIRGAAQLLERELTDPHLHEYTRIIMQEADRLRALVDRLFGPNQPLSRSWVNIHELLDRVQRLIEAEVQSGVRLQTDYDPSLPAIHADADQLIQAFLNIIRNAVEAMEQSGNITLRTRVERQFTVGQKRHRLVLRVDFEDDGPGIPEELLEHISHPMVTGRAQGSGLGLAITHDIIAKHGGLIECRSRPQRTVFSVYLPLENGEDNG